MMLQTHRKQVYQLQKTLAKSGQHKISIHKDRNEHLRKQECTKPIDLILYLIAQQMTTTSEHSDLPRGRENLSNLKGGKLLVNKVLDSLFSMTITPTFSSIGSSYAT